MKKSFYNVKPTILVLLTSVFLITFISAGFNALIVNLYMSRNNLSFPNAITDIEQVFKFLIGDLFGTVIVFMFLVTCRDGLRAPVLASIHESVVRLKLIVCYPSMALKRR